MNKSEKSNEAVPFSGYQKLVVVILALINFTVILDFMILSPLGDILMKSLNMNTAQFGSVVSAYAISAGISGLLAAGFADKYDRKKLLLFFYVGFLLGTVLCGLSDSFHTLFAARIVTGIFGGVISSISMAILTDVFSLQQRGRVMGFVQMAFAGSQILGIPIGIYLAEKFNWQFAFYMVVLLAFLVGLLIVVKLRPITAHLALQQKSNALKHLWDTLKKRDYRTGFLATALLSMGGFMLMPFTSAFLVNNVGILQKDLPLIFLFTGLSSIIIMPIIGKLSDRFDKFRIFSIGSIIAAIMVLIYTNMPPVSIAVVIAVNMVLFMGIMSRMVPATALNSAVPDTSDRGAYMSINSSLQQMAGGLAAIFAGLVVYQPHKNAPIENFNVLGMVMAGLIGICVYLVYRVSKLIKSREVKN